MSVKVRIFRKGTSRQYAEVWYEHKGEEMPLLDGLTFEPVQFKESIVLLHLEPEHPVNRACKVMMS